MGPFQRPAKEEMTMLDPRLPLVQDADLDGKVVLVRLDHNVVKKGVVKEDRKSVV